MENITDISDLLEKCKDKDFINNNRDRIRKCILKNPLKEQAKALLASKKNFFVLKLMETANIPAEDLLPPLEDRRNINQYVYSTYYYLYKANLVSSKLFEETKNHFKCMKNYEKMFMDTESSFIISRIEADRRKYKMMRRKFNKVVEVGEELKSLLIELPDVGIDEAGKIKDISSSGQNVFVINIDPVFSTDGLRSQIREDVTRKISEIRNGLFYIDGTRHKIRTLGAIGKKGDNESCDAEFLQNLKNDRYCRFERVFNGPERTKYVCTPLFYTADRFLKNRITRLYDLIMKLCKMQQKVYLTSICPLSQILAELLFFEYFSIDIRNVISVTETSSDIYQEIQDREGARVIIVGGEPASFLRTRNIYRIGHERFEKMVGIMSQSQANMRLISEGLGSFSAE